MESSGNIPHVSCACEVCENTKLFIRGVNVLLAEKLPIDEQKIIDKFTCAKDLRTANCMTGNCDLCPSTKVEFKSDVDEITDASSNDTNADSDSGDSSTVVKYYKWATVDSKVQKISVEIDAEDAEDALKEKVSTLRYPSRAVC